MTTTPLMFVAVATGFWGFGAFCSSRVFSAFGYIPPAKGKNAREVLDAKDHLFVLINSAITVLYFYHFYNFMMTSESIIWASDKLSVWNTLGSILLAMGVYDLFYVPFHWSLHIPAIYPWIHKHHHRQLAPTRGTIDGVNTHPIEYTTGLYLHILCLHLIPMHIYGLMGFFSITSFMASINHTRWAVRIPYVFDVRDHDLHHQIPRCNYAQYVPWWDWALGTHRNPKSVE